MPADWSCSHFLMFQMADRVEEARARLAASKATAHTQQAPAIPPPMESLGESMPTGAEAVNILGAVRDTRPRMNSSRRLFGESDQQASSSNAQLPQLPAGQSLLADRFEVRLSPLFNDVADGLEALDNTKAALTEWESRFGDASYKDKEAHARMLSLHDARDLLCAELQNTEQLEKKVGLLTKRCGDLEKKLRNAETYAKKVFDVYYTRTHDEVAVLLNEIRAKEVELLGRVGKAETERNTFVDQLEAVKENLRAVEKREEDVRKELAETMAAYRSACDKQQKAAAAAEVVRGENGRLDQQVRALQSQLATATDRERESRTESARHADTARAARESEERRVAAITLEANRRMAENERKANAEMERLRSEGAAEYAQLQTRARAIAEELRTEKEESEKYEHRWRQSETKVADWQQRFDRKIEEERAELQKQIASSYRGIMSNIAPARRINTGDEENASAYPLFSSRRREPSPRPDRPPSRGPPLAAADDNSRKRQLRDIITTALPPPRR